MAQDILMEATLRAATLGGSCCEKGKTFLVSFLVFLMEATATQPATQQQR